MRLAASAGGDARENLAYVQTLLGNLELARGRVGAAPRRLQPGARPAIPNTPPRRRGSRAPPPRAATWPPRSAATSAWSSVCRCPSTRWRSPKRSWRPVAARTRARTSRWCEVQQRLLRRGGVNVDAEMAVVEADHGSAERAVRLARRGMGRRAQRARRGCARLGADAGRRARPGPARTRSARCGSARATRCSCTTPGSRRATPGAPALARRYLTRALDAQPALLAAARSPRAARAGGLR